MIITLYLIAAIITGMAVTTALRLSNKLPALESGAVGAISAIAAPGLWVLGLVGLVLVLASALFVRLSNVLLAVIRRHRSAMPTRS